LLCFAAQHAIALTANSAESEPIGDDFPDYQQQLHQRLIICLEGIHESTILEQMGQRPVSRVSSVVKYRCLFHDGDDICQGEINGEINAKSALSSRRLSPSTIPRGRNIRQA
jgi:hypothetical protein